MNPLFYKGQRVICCQKSEIGSKGNKSPLIEGKRYYISNPDWIRDKETIYVGVSGIEEGAFDQNHFIPETFNDECEEEIKRSLNSHLLTK